MESGHRACAKQSWSVPGTGSSPRERLPLPICVPRVLFCTSSPARGHRVTFLGGCARAAGSCCPPAPAQGTRTAVLLSLPSWQVTSRVMDRVWERQGRSQEQQRHHLSSCEENGGGPQGGGDISPGQGGKQARLKVGFIPELPSSHAEPHTRASPGRAAASTGYRARSGELRAGNNQRANPMRAAAKGKKNP